jgi:hypothetical protein
MTTHSVVKFRARLAGFYALSLLMFMTCVPGTSAAQQDSYDGQPETAATTSCPDGWVTSSAPGGCSPGFFTLKLVRLPDTDDCPDGWVRSSAPGGCSPGFFTLKLNDVGDTKGCPAGWVTSSAPGGCSPGYLTLRLAGISPTDGCPDGWVASSAPGGCSPGSFTLKQRQVYQAQYHCAFGVHCDMMVEAILALGGSCNRDGPDTTCELPPLIED